MINPSMGASFQVRGFNPRTCTLSGLDIKVSIPLPLIYQLDGLREGKVEKGKTKKRYLRQVLVLKVKAKMDEGHNKR